MVQGQYVGFGGGFNSPASTPGIQNLQFNLAYWVVPVPLMFGETVLQASDREISLLKVRMNDVYAVTRQQMALKTFSLNTANPLFPDSFANAFDDGTNAVSYGGISRTAQGNAAYKGQYINMNSGLYSTTFSVGVLGFTRKSMSTLIGQVANTAGGEIPTFIVMAPGDYAVLNNDFIGIETQFVNPGNSYTMDTMVRSSFPNLNVAGVPIFQDSFCPKGVCYGVNVKYTSMYLSEDAAFDFSGFHSLVPLGQIGQQGIVVVGYDFISAKPVSGFQAYNIGGALY